MNKVSLIDFLNCQQNNAINKKAPNIAPYEVNPKLTKLKLPFNWL